MNDGTVALVLFIKAVDFMQLCEAFSVNPTREASPQSHSRRLQEQTSPLPEGHPLSDASLTTGPQQRELFKQMVDQE